MNSNGKNKNSNMELDLAALLGQPETTPKLHIKKYINYLLAKKHWIFISALLFSLLWYFGYSYYKERMKEYTASTIIRFDDPRTSRNIGALTDFSAGIATQGRAEILYTNLFLRKVVDSLKLNLEFREAFPSRTEILKSIQFSEDLDYGTYFFALTYDIKLYYLNENGETTETLIKKFPLSARDSLVVETGGFSAVFSIPDWFEGDELYFSIVPDLYAVETVRSSLYYYLERRSDNLLTISFSHKDPHYAKYICNKMASIYIEHLTEFKRYKTASILNSLEQQLLVSQSQLEAAERNLQLFQERNPRVYLTQDRGDYIKDLADDEIAMRSLDIVKRQINEIESKLSISTELLEKYYIYQEILSFLEQQNQPGVSVFIESLSQEIFKLEQLYSQRYPETHPDVQRIKERIYNIQKQADKRLKEFKNELMQQENELLAEIDRSEQVLNRIPKKQLRLAELERERIIKAGIVSSIMSRFNEAKVSDAAIIPDVQIIDYAEVPLIMEEGIVKKGISLLIGALIGIALATAVLTLVVLSNAKYWTSEELEEKTGLTVFAKVPVLNMDRKELPVLEDKIDPMLVTYSYEPTMGGESFRRMRTILDMEAERKNGSLLVGSLNPAEGKSFVSLNLATVYAQQKQKVLLIDGDIRKGVLHSYFSNQKKPGLTDLLMSKQAISHELITYFIQKTDVPNLFLLPSGQLVPNPAELLSLSRFGQLVTYLSKIFSKIVIDSAPFGLCTDLFIMNRWVHNILLVTKYQSTNLTDLKNLLNEFGEVKDDFRGVAVNCLTERSKKYGYSGYNFYKY